MEKKDFRFVRVTENIEIPVPKDCTSSEEQVLIAEFKARHDLAELEKEAQELNRAIKDGNLVSSQDTLLELGMSAEAPRTPA